MSKFLTYTLVVVSTVVITVFIDRQTIDQERTEGQKVIQPYVNIIKEQEIKIRTYEEIIQNEDNLQQTFEVRHDSVISIIRDANEQRDYARLDSLGESLLDRLRKRQR